MLAAIGRDDYVVALEVRATSMTTEQLSAWLAARLRAAQPLALLIGGPDGLSEACRARADKVGPCRPHPAARAGARPARRADLPAMSLLAGHPYHRA